MAGKSSIEWTQRTWNPIVGCTIVSPGCTNCYAMQIADRFKDVYQGRRWAGAAAEAVTRRVNGKPIWTGQLVMAPYKSFSEPLRRKKPSVYFVNSMGDLFHEDCPDEWIELVFDLMAKCPQHIFQVLTKRAGRMRKVMSEMAAAPLPNVFLGVSVERQEEANERIPMLLQTPAAVRFVSCEPLLGFVRLDNIYGRIDWMPEEQNQFDALHPLLSERLNWVIAGAESGHGARDCDVEWVRSLKNQCVRNGVPFFYKQHAVKGRKIPTPELDGRKWTELPGVAA
jgi:protein gp37